ncbi:MAG: signal peptidase II [Aeriscardovia sp.]|nr:signal peptidase II [Aeriscardovia sp.]
MTTTPPILQRTQIRISTDLKRAKSKRTRRKVFFFSLSLLLLGADLSSKELAQSYLSGRSVPLAAPFLSLRLLCNPGATLGVLSSHTWVVGIIEILGCAGFALGISLADSPLLLTAFSLGLAGGSGNLADRIIHAHGFLNGCVVDFIDYGWSVGNVADIYLFLCAVCICIFLFRFDKKRGKDEKSSASSRKPGRRKV